MATLTDINTVFPGSLPNTSPVQYSATTTDNLTTVTSTATPYLTTANTANSSSLFGKPFNTGDNILLKINLGLANETVILCMVTSAGGLRYIPTVDAYAYNRAITQASAATSTVTDSNVSATDVILVAVQNNSANATLIKVAAGAGSFVITWNASITSATISYIIYKVK